MKKEITDKRKLLRYYALGERVSSTINTHNNLSALMFKSISKFSSLLPDSLNTLSILSDMITDAIVVSGRSSLSKAPAELQTKSSGLAFNVDTGELTLAHRVQYKAAIKNSKSFIQTDGNYNIFNTKKDSLSAFSDLLNGAGITIVSNTNSYRYTFCIEFAAVSDINSILIKLNKDTDSYPLLSELYYINTENKREYVTFLNSFDTKFDLDSKRVNENEYNLIFNTIKTNRIYLTLEDRDKVDLSIDELSVRKLLYAASGDIVFGPIVSTFPILKASVEASGDIDGASFYISKNAVDWIEVALPSEISKDASVNKLVAFNTISKDSIKSSTDVKELYLKVSLEQKVVNPKTEAILNKSSDFYASNLPYPANTNPIDTSVYQLSSETYYGDKTFVSSVQASLLREPEHNYIINNGTYMVKSFKSTVNGYDDSSTFNSVTTSVMKKKVNGDQVDASIFEPLSAKVSGYSVNKVKKTCNVLFEDTIVLQLKDTYTRDIYTVRQNNKELKIDLSLGFIDSCINSVIGVDKEGVVNLYDSTGKEVKILQIREFNDFHYISLVEEDMFFLPINETQYEPTLNPLYPIRLNEKNEYGILDSKLVSVKSLVSFEEVFVLSYEDILTSLVISKENKNVLQLEDNLLKNKYTEQAKEQIAAYTDSRAIKLQNKHIKKGSLRITQS